MRSELFKLLAADTEASVRRALAENSEIDYDIQATLAKDKDNSVLAALAGNPNLSDKLKKMKSIADFKGKEGISRKAPSVPSVSLSEVERRRLLDQGSKSALVLLGLDDRATLDDRKTLLNAVNQSIEIDGKLVELYDTPKVALILNKNCEPEIYTALEKSSHLIVQEALASKVNCPEAILKKLLKKKTSVRWCIANPLWYQLPHFFNDLVDMYKNGGIREIQESDRATAKRLKELLDGSYKPAAVKSYKVQLREFESSKA